ncbi:olfactory receptor 10T2-like [Phacochoerus africanus]|uniref:olfactory receptor 10T2-like n=1 Tax=Phacochoerus africanus TaxID=41426 RepID=UPI001FD8D093|nr:olfactory receptor 10T2-like [Phacochoerus africanus]
MGHLPPPLWPPTVIMHLEQPSLLLFFLFQAQSSPRAFVRVVVSTRNILPPCILSMDFRVSFQALRAPEKQRENATWLVTQFVLVGFSNLPDLRTPLFALFFFIYLVTLSGNVTIITIIHVDRTLHTPMYCFLALLSLSETCYTLVTIPNMLAHLLMENQAISIPGCRAQMFFFLGLGCSHCFLLTLMGYDRYVAICHPLRYSVIMRPTFCLCLGILVFCSGFSVALIETSLIFSSPFCHSDRVEHFFCDIAPVLKLSCAESASKALAIFFLSILVVLVSFLLILLSYAFIVATIVRIPSAAGRHKAFSTCAAHLTVVIVHFGCASIIYLRPESRGNPDQDRLVAVFYTVVTPLLNPVVYTLRNKEVRVALSRTLGAKPRNFKITLAQRSRFSFS